MAFAKQYFSSYKSNNNLDYYLEIWVDGYTGGNPTEIKLGAGGPVISYDTDQEDRFSPILSSQCELPFMVTGVGTEFFIRQLREVYKDKQVYLHLYRATSSTYSTVKPIWSGFLIMDLGSGEDVSFPYEQKLKFVDGLSLLKDIDFVDLSRTDTPPGDTIPLNERTQGNYSKFNMYYGPALYTFWIKEILKKVGAATSGVSGQGVSLNYGFTTAVNWYNGKMQNTNQASDPLGLTKCVVTMFHEKNDQEVFTPDNCYLVLKELLRHWGARITYWQHEFWIVQIPEYITTESGSLNNPTNINSRQYDLSGSLLGSQDYLGDEYYTRYEQTIQTDKVSKIVGTQYNYLPMINNVDAQFLSFASNNYYGGFPYGNNAENQEIYQGTIVDPSTADFLFLSIPLNWVWDMGSSALVNGHTNGWHCQVRFNFFASQLLNGTVTTFYLQYDSNGSYYWIPGANWRPLGTESPNYKIKSRQLVESNYVGFEEQIPFVDSSGNPISMLGDWDFFLDIEKYGTSGNNPGSFICNFLGYGYQIRQFKPQTTIGGIPSPSGSGSTTSGTVSWSNTLEVPGTTNFSILPFSQLGFNAGTSTLDIRLITSSPFRGVLQALNTTQAATYGITLNTQIDNNTNTERYSFGTLLWGDAVQSFAIGALRVNTGTAFDKTDADGEWGRGILTGDKTFTELLIHEFLTGQLEVVISPSMRLVVGDSNKDVTISGVTRPRFVNPIGILRETRNGPDPVYFFRRGSFHSLYDEWDYEGYQILRDSVTSTTTTNDIGDLGGSQDSNPVSAAKLIGNVTDALSTNSTIASLRQTIPSIGANVAVNGNFNVATGWTLGTGWTIDTTASKAKFAATGSLSSLSQINLTEGTKYQVIFTIDITAGQLTVKAGSSGSSQVITVAGQYELYLLCEGSTSIQFQAGTTFTGSISQVSIADQKSLSSVPIESLGEAIFKTNDTFNIVNSINGEVIPLTVTSNQGATDTAISVTAVPLFDDIGIDSVLLINQDDLSAQYQNKTKGTVAGFDITATGIEKSSINITDWLNSDTMTGAAVTNVPTALSVKNYVDGQVGASDTLQEVTDNGNTTSNSIMIGSSSSPSNKLDVQDTSATYVARFRGASATYVQSGENTLSGETGFLAKNSTGALFMAVSSGVAFLTGTSGANTMTFGVGGAEKMRITSAGNLGIGTTAPVYKLDIRNSGNLFYGQTNLTNTTSIFRIRANGGSNEVLDIHANGNVGIGTANPTEKLHVVGDALITGDSHADAFKPAVSGNPIKFKNFDSTTEFARITDGGNLLLGTTVDSGDKLNITGSIAVSDLPFNSNSVSVLVANETIGAEQVTNGNFTELPLGTGWSSTVTSPNIVDFQSGSVYLKRTISAANELSQNQLLIGVLNKVVIDARITSVGIALEGNGDFTRTNLLEGINTFIFTPTTTNLIIICVNNTTEGYVDSVSVKQVTSASNQIQKREVGTGAFGPTPVGAYLPLTGGTLTGALTGTTATFSGQVTASRYSVGDSNAFVDRDSNSLTLLTYAGYPITIKPGNSESTRFLANGNLLIGSTSDNGQKLQVYGNLLVDNSTAATTGTAAVQAFFKGGSLFGGDYRDGQIAFGQSISLSGAVGWDNSTAGVYLDNRWNNNIGFIAFRTKASAAVPNEAMRITGVGNLLLGTTSDNSQKLQVTGNIRITGGFQASNTGGFLLADTGGSMRYGLKYGAAGAVGATNLMMLTNRSLSSATGGGEVAIAANASTTGVTETEVMRIKANTQSQVSIDGVLSLTFQNTPADPPNRASTIWLDSNFDLKIKITNNSGVTVTKTLAEYA